jgi:hypothetical protein
MNDSVFFYVQCDGLTERFNAVVESGIHMRNKLRLAVQDVDDISFCHFESSLPSPGIEEISVFATITESYTNFDDEQRVTHEYKAVFQFNRIKNMIK